MRLRPWLRLAGTALGVGLLVACSPALREPPALQELSGVGPGRPDATEIVVLLAQAEEAFALRSPVEVRRAASMWARAAVGDPSLVEAWAGAVRSRVWLADHEPDAAERESIAVEAVHAAQWCEWSAPGQPVCAYWLGVALGVQARERRSTALDALPRMIDLLQEAAQGDPELDRAGPDRVLALVYLRAPGWPTGPGDVDLGLEHAREAVRIDPEFPPNQLALAEAFRETESATESRRSYELALSASRQWQKEGRVEAAEWIDEAQAALEGLDGR